MNSEPADSQTAAGAPPAARAQSARPSLAGYLVGCFLAVYLIASIFFWAWVLGDGATGTFRTLTSLGMALPSDPDSVNLLKLAYFAAVGGAVGGVTFGMVNLQHHVTAGTFRAAYIGDYLFRPFGAAVLALVVFSLARGGLLTVLGVDPTSGSSTAASKLSSLGVGFLVGFASVRVVKFLNALAAQTFDADK